VVLNSCTEADEYQSVDAAEEKPFWRGPPQDIDLLAQHQDLRLKLCSPSFISSERQEYRHRRAPSFGC